MGREHSPKGQVVLRKAEKLAAIDASLPPGSSPEAYADKFRETYPDDWQRIVSRYGKHERLTKPGKHHPMPNPEQYLLNMVNVFLKKKEE